MTTLRWFLCVILLAGCARGTIRAGGPLPLSLCAQSPVVEVAVAPVFPDIAKRGRVFGRISISVSVTDEGSIADAKILGDNPNLLLGNPALAAAKKWRFNRTFECGLRTASLVFDFKQPVPAGWGEATIFTPPYGVEVVVEEVRAVLDRNSTKTP